MIEVLLSALNSSETEKEWKNDKYKIISKEILSTKYFDDKFYDFLRRGVLSMHHRIIKKNYIKGRKSLKKKLKYKF